MIGKIVQFILFLFFIAFVLCAIVVGSYMLNNPSYSGDSRLIISGPWIDKENNTTFEFNKDSKFKIVQTDNEHLIAEGYYKIDESAKKIKLFILPGHYDKSFKDSINLTFFAQILYSDLVGVIDEDNATKEELEIIPSVDFLLKKSETLYSCEMPEKTLDLYSGK